MKMVALNRIRQRPTTLEPISEPGEWAEGSLLASGPEDDEFADLWADFEKNQQAVVEGTSTRATSVVTHPTSYYPMHKAASMPSAFCPPKGLGNPTTTLYGQMLGSPKSERKNSPNNGMYGNVWPVSGTSHYSGAGGSSGSSSASTSGSYAKSKAKAPPGTGGLQRGAPKKMDSRGLRQSMMMNAARGTPSVKTYHNFPERSSKKEVAPKQSVESHLLWRPPPETGYSQKHLEKMKAAKAKRAGSTSRSTSGTKNLRRISESVSSSEPSSGVSLKSDDNAEEWHNATEVEEVDKNSDDTETIGIVVAEYDFNPENLPWPFPESTHPRLSFKTGQVIHLIVDDDQGWSFGRVGDCHGYFPTNYAAKAGDDLDRHISEDKKDKKPASSSTKYAVGENSKMSPHSSEPSINLHNEVEDTGGPSSQIASESSTPKRRNHRLGSGKSTPVSSGRTTPSKSQDFCPAPQQRRPSSGASALEPGEREHSSPVFDDSSPLFSSNQSSANNPSSPNQVGEFYSIVSSTNVAISGGVGGGMTHDKYHDPNMNLTSGGKSSSSDGGSSPSRNSARETNKSSCENLSPNYHSAFSPSSDSPIKGAHAQTQARGIGKDNGNMPAYMLGGNADHVESAPTNIIGSNDDTGRNNKRSKSDDDDPFQLDITLEEESSSNISWKSVESESNHNIEISLETTSSSWPHSPEEGAGVTITHTEGADQKQNPLERGDAEEGRSGTMERDGEMVVVTTTSSSIGLGRDGGEREKIVEPHHVGMIGHTDDQLHDRGMKAQESRYAPNNNNNNNNNNELYDDDDENDKEVSHADSSAAAPDGDSSAHLWSSGRREPEFAPEGEESPFSHRPYMLMPSITPGIHKKKPSHSIFFVEKRDAFEDAMKKREEAENACKRDGESTTATMDNPSTRSSSSRYSLVDKENVPIDQDPPLSSSPYNSKNQDDEVENASSNVFRLLAPKASKLKGAHAAAPVPNSTRSHESGPSREEEVGEKSEKGESKREEKENNNVVVRSAVSVMQMMKSQYAPHSSEEKTGAGGSLYSHSCLGNEVALKKESCMESGAELQDMTEDGSEIVQKEASERQELHDVWAQIETQTEAYRIAREAKPSGKIELDPKRPLRFEEIKKYLYTLPINQQALNELTETIIPSKGFLACFQKPRTLRDIPRLERSRKTDADNVHSWVKTNYNPQDDMHRRIIQTLFQKVHNNEFPPLMTGKHWEDIGFQGNCPSTDLNRFGGLFNLIVMFHMLEKTPKLLAKIHRLSQHETQHFPLMCTSIHFTKLAVDLFRMGALSHLRGPFLDIICEVHNALLTCFYEKWRTGNRTIQDFQRTYKEVEEVTRNLKKLLRFFRKMEDEVENASSNIVANLVFTDLEQRAAGTAKATGTKPLTNRMKQYSSS